MQVQFVRTEVVRDDLYIDLLMLDEVPHTFAMEKVAEPNVFEVKESVNSDKFSEFVEKYAVLSPSGKEGA